MMDQSERLFKVLLECVFLLLVGIPLYFLIDNTILLMIVSVLIAHSLNLLFNGQLMVALKNIGRTSRTSQEIDQFTNDIRIGASKNKSVAFLAIFGSNARRSALSNSDLDVRVIRRRGLGNGLSACLFTMRIRLLGLRRRLPIDIYLLDSSDSLRKHITPEELENAIVLFDADNLMNGFANKKSLSG